MWRGKQIDEVEEYLPEGERVLQLMEKKFEGVITCFIRNIFHDENIEVTLFRKPAKKGPAIGFSSPTLDQHNNYTSFYFANKLFKDQIYIFNISNIPATTHNRYIKVFFHVMMRYLELFYEILKEGVSIRKGVTKVTPNFLLKCDIWLYNIERTIIVEYIYHLFNTDGEDNSSKRHKHRETIRYDLDLINKIVDFANELSTRKIENEEIFCGFIFHDDLGEIKSNAVKSIKFKRQIDFGSFSSLKNYLEISNGQNLFFNVTDGKITHLLITKLKVNQIRFGNPRPDKTFHNSPLILSIQGSGKILFLEGRSDINNVFLQIINSRPIIKDSNFIKKFLVDSLQAFSTAEEDQINFFTKWLVSLSYQRQGTSLIFCENIKMVEKQFIKTFSITLDQGTFTDEDRENNLTVLNSLVTPDGAVVFNKQLVPTHISTILPIAQSKTYTSGGARHNSVANFSRKHKCLGIVISEDGPITIFQNGISIIKF